MPSDQRGDDRSTVEDKSWSPSSGTDPVSPELVLVSPPDEARRLREQLPESSAAEWDRLRSRDRAGPGLPSSERSRHAPRRRRLVRRTVIVGAMLLLVASAVAVGLAGSRDTGGKGEAHLTLGPVRHRSSTATPTTPATTVETSHAQTAPGRTPPAPQRKAHAPARATSTKKPSKKAPAKKKPTQARRPARPAPTGFVPARTWSWEPQARARRYVFTLQRDGKRVIAARTTKPRFVLPNRFRFAAGRYRWRVVAVTTKPGARRQVVVDSKFRLSTAGAAAANG